MKKAIIVAILLILFAVGAFVGPLLFAQERAAPAPTKVAMVNIRAVLKENAKAKALQAELEETLKPHKAKAKKLSDEIDAMTKALTTGKGSPTWNSVALKQKEWDAVNADILSLIEEKHKEKLPAVWNEVNQAVEAVAKTYGFQIVLGHGDPDDPEMSKLQGAKASKLRTTDMGGTVAAYVHGSIDITPVVIATLKR